MSTRPGLDNRWGVVGRIVVNRNDFIRRIVLIHDGVERGRKAGGIVEYGDHNRNEDMRVVHLCKAFSKLSETFIYDYVAEQQRQDIDAHVVTGERRHPEERPYEPVTVVPWPSVWHPRRVGYRLAEIIGMQSPPGSGWRALWPNLQREIGRIQPDVLHAHFGRCGVKAVPVAEHFNLPLVVTFYGYDISQLPREPGWKTAYESIWETASAIVVLSEEMKARAEHWGAPPDKIYVVHLARALDAFSYRAPQPPLTEAITVGRLTEKKGHFDAVDAVKRLVEDGRPMRLRIVGDGPLRKELEAYIQRKGVADHVDLMGARSNAEVIALLEAADFFLLCSKTSSTGDREGTPTVLIEAQAIGLPCVSTTHAGIPEMIPESNHRFLAKEGEVEEIEMGVRQLLGCSEVEVKQVAEKGREKIESDFLLSREVEGLCEIYEQEITGRY